MKVKDLIEELKKVDPNSTVMYLWYNEYEMKSELTEAMGVYQAKYGEELITVIDDYRAITAED